MRLRSEWLTLFTLTVAVAGAVALPRGGTPGPSAARRIDMTAAGIDDRPVGSIKGGDRTRRPRSKPAAAHP